MADTESPDEEFFDIIPVYSMKLFGYRNQIGFYSTKGTSVKNYRQMEVTGEILKKTADHYSSNMTKLKVSKTYAIPAARFKSFIDWYAKAGSALMLAAEYNSDREWKLRDIWLEAAENAYQEGDKGYLSVVEQLNLSDLRAT
ncbi:MAG: hypothetical protein GKC04_03300 [Methanomicrobiales archaeon]|nr:hypothetical protein [Methanomicrobiales archaeon]